MRWKIGVFSGAIRRVRGPVLVPLLAGNASLLVAAVLGLQIPDSHAWQVLLSGLLALGLLSGLLLWNAAALRRLRSTVPSVALWHAALVLGGWLLLGAIFVHLADLATADVETRAGYWNSQLSAALRHLFPYSRLISLQQFAIHAMQWLLVPAIVTPLAEETVIFGLRKDALSRSVRVLASAQHWAVALVAFCVFAFIVPTLVSWHPAHSVSGESLSVLLRLATAALLVIASVLALLAVDAELLHRANASAISHDETASPSTDKTT